jgi:hypothetical protein
MGLELFVGFLFAQDILFIILFWFPVNLFSLKLFKGTSHTLLLLLLLLLLGGGLGVLSDNNDDIELLFGPPPTDFLVFLDFLCKRRGPQAEGISILYVYSKNKYNNECKSS